MYPSSTEKLVAVANTEKPQNDVNGKKSYDSFITPGQFLPATVYLRELEHRKTIESNLYQDRLKATLVSKLSKVNSLRRPQCHLV